MLENQKIRSGQVVGPFGTALTLADLPPVNARWTPRRKAEVVVAVCGGLLTMQEACERYTLSIEEFTSWVRAHERSGLHGLRTTRTQQYRALFERS